VRTFLELLIGSLPSPSGHLTDVWLSVQARGHWSTPYKWLVDDRAGEDGAAFLQRLRADPVHADLPVVICTGKILLPSEREKLAKEAAAIVPKGEGLADQLRSVLARLFPPNLLPHQGAGKAPAEGGRETPR